MAEEIDDLTNHSIDVARGVSDVYGSPDYRHGGRESDRVEIRRRRTGGTEDPPRAGQDFLNRATTWWNNVGGDDIVAEPRPIGPDREQILGFPVDRSPRLRTMNEPMRFSEEPLVPGYAAFLEQEEALNTLTERSTSTPRALSGNPTGETLGQHNLLPRVARGVYDVGAHIVQSTYQSFLNLERDLSTSTRPSETAYSPGDSLTAALTPLTGAIPAVTAGGLGVMGGRVGAGRLASQGSPEALDAMRTYEQLMSQGLDASRATASSVRTHLGGTELGQVYRGSDGRLRVELSDHQAQLTPFATELTFPPTGRPSAPLMQANLNEVLEHPELFRMYPELADTTVTIHRMTNVPGGVRGSFDHNTNHIQLTAENASWARQGLLHEIQHRVQSIEGFARGSNPTHSARNANATTPTMARLLTDREWATQGAPIFWSPPQQEAIVNAAKVLWPEFTGKTVQDLNKWASRTFNDGPLRGGLAENLSRETGWQLYRREAGEVEGRLVEQRRNMSPSERRRVPVEHGTEYEGILVGEGFHRDSQIVSLDRAATRQAIENSPRLGDTLGVLNRAGIAEDSIRIRQSRQGDSYYVTFPDKDGNIVKVRVSDHQRMPAQTGEPGTLRKHELDSYGLTPQELEAEIRRRLGDG